MSDVGGENRSIGSGWNVQTPKTDAESTLGNVRCINRLLITRNMLKPNGAPEYAQKVDTIRRGEPTASPTLARFRTRLVLVIDRQRVMHSGTVRIGRDVFAFRCPTDADIQW